MLSPTSNLSCVIMTPLKTAFYLLLLLCCISTCRTIPIPNFSFADNIVIAHRGAWKTDKLPQNSIAALRKAIGLGCTGSEFDVRMTADEVLVVTHDADYHGMQVEETTYAELSKVKLANGEKLPTVKDYIKAGLKENKTTGLVFEIKPSKYKERNPIIAEKSVNIVRSLNAERHILSYISFSYDILLKIKALDPSANTQYLDGSKSPDRLYQDGITGLDYAVHKLKKQSSWIRIAKDKGIVLNAWTANEQSDIQWLIANGFDYITTDEPELTFKLASNSPDADNLNSSSLTAMTYNIRLDVPSDGDNAWPERKEHLCSQVKFYNPDIMGVQEARPHQMRELQQSLDVYQTIGIGRDEGEWGEYSAIFYNASKLNVKQQNTFWLSETPTEISKGWDAAYPRICTYGLFTTISGGKKFWVFNTHLDHKGQQAQVKGIQLVLDRIATVNTEGLPVVLMGDFNVEPDSKLMAKLKVSMNDSKEKANHVYGPNGTFNGFNYTEPATRRIDYIMVSKADIVVEKYGVLSSAINSKYPSDHFPVFTSLSLQ